MSLALDTDLYQLTMIQSYINHDKFEESVFDLFYRRVFDSKAYVIFTGLEDIIDYVENLKFNKNDISYLKSLKDPAGERIFRDGFLQYLSDFRFSGEIYAQQEGSMVFPQEPILRVKAPLPEAQLLETTILSIVNGTSLTATKASRVAMVARKHHAKTLEFGLRRAHGLDNGLKAARASYIAGMDGTSNVRAGQIYGIPVSGTHAHSYVQSYADEIEAFHAYSSDYPAASVLLVDTYDTISGLEKAINVLQQLKQQGNKPLGIRLDSGDIVALSKIARQMLDEAGLAESAIVVSGDLDDDKIAMLYEQGAKMDILGIGTKLYYSAKALGAVYKLAAIKRNSTLESVMKISDDQAKRTLPGLKSVYRLYDEGHAVGDIVSLNEERVAGDFNVVTDDGEQQQLHLDKYQLKSILVPIFKQGELVYDKPSIEEIRQHCLGQVDRLANKYRNGNDKYPVYISEKLSAMQQAIVDKHE